MAQRPAYKAAIVTTSMAPTGLRTIVHVDLDAFYASVEQRDDPSLVGKPVVVGGDIRRGVVCASSYEARKFGIRSAMSMAQACKLCPSAVVIAPRMSHYAEVSAGFFAILNQFSPLVEGLSLDEAFIDVTGMGSLYGDGLSIAIAIKKVVRERLGLVVSAGVAPNKFVAKIGSDLRKPDGLVVVQPGEIQAFLHDLPVSRLWGVGAVTNAALQSFGIQTIGDVAQIPIGMLQARLGRGLAEHLSALSMGIDDRPVNPDREAVSISHEDTFERDERSFENLISGLGRQADRVAERLRRQGLRAKVVVLKIKYANHKLVSRRKTLVLATADGGTLGKTAAELLQSVPGIASLGVRLTGVGAGGLVPADESDFLKQERQSQLSLLGPTVEETQLSDALLQRNRAERLGHTLDSIRDRFGSSVIGRSIVSRTE